MGSSGIQIKQLKHDREQRIMNANYSDTSKDRMKQMTEKHKKKARQKQKKDKKIKEKKKNNTKLGNKYDTSSTRSSSKSISPQASLSPNGAMSNGLNSNHLCDPAPPSMPAMNAKKVSANAQNRSNDVVAKNQSANASNT